MEVRKLVQSADLVVVGSGFFGATVAERAASSGFEVLLLERRSHVGGNAYSYFDESSGIEVHKYGSHLFHTSNQRVWEYALRFTEFNNYQHHVWTTHSGKVYSMPINLLTISQFYGRDFSPEEAKSMLANTESDPPVKPRNLEEKAISSIGEDLYRALIRGYTKKQWETDPRKLPPGVISRLPVRFNYNTRYFSDTWEGLPLDGYSAWIERMLADEKISVLLEVDFFDVKDLIPSNVPVVYTGAIDRYFEYSQGHLSWRTLDFDFSVVEVDDYQGAAVMNFADEEVPFTRTHEFKHLHPERKYPRGKTVIAKEFSRQAKEGDEPYYPVNTPEDRRKLTRYRRLAEMEEGVFFGGRLGSYQYLDMHMAIASALTFWEDQLFRRLETLA